MLGRPWVQKICSDDDVWGMIAADAVCPALVSSRPWVQKSCSDSDEVVVSAAVLRGKRSRNADRHGETERVYAMVTERELFDPIRRLESPREVGRQVCTYWIPVCRLINGMKHAAREEWIERTRGPFTRPPFDIVPSRDIPSRLQAFARRGKDNVRRPPMCGGTCRPCIP